MSKRKTEFKLIQNVKLSIENQFFLILDSFLGDR